MCFGNLPKNQYFAIFRPKRGFLVFFWAHFLNKCPHLTVGDLNDVHVNEVHVNDVHVNEVVHVNDAHVNDVHVNDVHVNDVHVNDVHLICYGRFL